ncbi:GvpL/GvpF family gas vesicle protein [Patescibacteria group bacterium]|nr:GvpL/GvpF family gas vesicle protein [Patescibacteria group bacterium]
MGNHIYGIIRASEKISFNPVGISGEGDMVYAIPYQDIAALISSSPSLAYDSVPKETLVRYLALHQAVMEGVMKNYTVIPMKFGTTARNEEEVEKILESGYSKFKDVLGRMDDKIELEMVALWNNLDSTLKEIGREERIKKFKEKVATKSAEKILSAKIELGKMVKSLLDEKRAKVGGQIMDELKKWVIDFHNHDILDDTMIMNTAFLVNKHREKDFERAINYLNKKYKDKINFRIIGPLPPYSFSTLELKRIKFEKIKEAAKILDLGEETTLSEVKQAYRNLTRRFHPDRNPQDPNARKRFEKISEAYHTLIDYYSDGEGCFKEKKNKDLVMIKILEISKGLDLNSVI